MGPAESRLGKANIARGLVQNPEIAIAETKIDGIGTGTGTGTAPTGIGTEIAIATAIVGDLRDHDHETGEIGRGIVTAIGTGTGETEIGTETEEGKDR